ncbi:recQ-mediated genome instability protein 1 [Plutella xylostella]|uniref:recQ-mediated genome instability protein 1 n=1 Tax=Plutella xylostella TaxID=51655 RepID=UPI0020324E98|nr:recQ-mediated genome instability protein 1 [Plutella xylostella]
MASTASRVNIVREYLKSLCMFVDDEWLTGCVEYLTEDSSNNYTVSELNNLAKEQWLLNDLKDICPGSLPANLKDQRKTDLTGRYVLQINATMDIGTPAYQQYLKLQKINTDNVEATATYEDKLPSHRMIKLYMTDGVQEVSGIEYQPMRNLSLDITPGCKILIKGPVECRHGVMFLTESHVELLGGEVQEIATSNCLAGLLANRLNLPATTETQNNTEDAEPPSTSNTTATVSIPPSRPPDPIPIFEPTPDPTPRPIARVTSLQVANFNDDDIDIDQLAAIEAQFNDNPSTNKRRSEDIPNPEKRQKIQTETNNSNDYPDDDDLFADEDDDYLRQMEAKFDRFTNEIQPKPPERKFPISIAAEPYVYIKQINEMSDMDKAGKVFRVKGQIMKLLSKLSVGKDGWSLKCTIVDGTGSLDVDFTSDVLSKLVGYTPIEMTQLKKQISKNPEMKEKAVSALQKAKNSLQVLYCIIELTVLDTPKITCLIPFDNVHVSMLKKRLDESGL